MSWWRREPPPPRGRRHAGSDQDRLAEREQDRLAERLTGMLAAYTPLGPALPPAAAGLPDPPPAATEVPGPDAVRGGSPDPPQPGEAALAYPVSPAAVELAPAALASLTAPVSGGEVRAPVAYPVTPAAVELEPTVFASLTASVRHAAYPSVSRVAAPEPVTPAPPASPAVVGAETAYEATAALLGTVPDGVAADPVDPPADLPVDRAADDGAPWQAGPGTVVLGFSDGSTVTLAPGDSRTHPFVALTDALAPPPEPPSR